MTTIISDKEEIDKFINDIEDNEFVNIIQQVHNSNEIVIIKVSSLIHEYITENDNNLLVYNHRKNVIISNTNLANYLYPDMTPQQLEFVKLLRNKRLLGLSNFIDYPYKSQIIEGDDNFIITNNNEIYFIRGSYDYEEKQKLFARCIGEVNDNVEDIFKKLSNIRLLFNHQLPIMVINSTSQIDDIKTSNEVENIMNMLGFEESVINTWKGKNIRNFNMIIARTSDNDYDHTIPINSEFSLVFENIRNIIDYDIFDKRPQVKEEVKEEVKQQELKTVSTHVVSFKNNIIRNADTITIFTTFNFEQFTDDELETEIKLDDDIVVSEDIILGEHTHMLTLSKVVNVKLIYKNNSAYFKIMSNIGKNSTEFTTNFTFPVDL